MEETSERGYVEDEETEPAQVGIGEKEDESGTGRRTEFWMSQGRRVMSCLLGLLLVLFCCLFAVAPDPGIGSGGSSPTLQNERIFCWGRSFEMGVGAGAGGTYPEHLERILGRDVDHSDFSSMWFSSSSVALDDVSYFDEHKYGVVTMRATNDGPEFPWNETEADLRELVRSLKDTGAVVVMFETGPLWDLDGQMTTTDEQCMTNTSHYVLEGVENPEFVCITVDGETQTEKYYELWGIRCSARSPRRRAPTSSPNTSWIASRRERKHALQ